MEKLLYQTFREGYGIDQVRRTMTVGELIDFLSDYDEDTPIYLSFDNGYTYGGLPPLRVRARSFSDALARAKAVNPGYCGGYIVEED